MKRNAFTLVELLIVVGIIGLLASIGVAAYSTTRVNARNIQRKANLTQAAKALEMYANDHGGLYPSSGGVWSTDYGRAANTYISGLSPTYMAVLPHDPNTGILNPDSPYSACRTTAGYNTYDYRSDGNDYKLIALCVPEGTLSATDPYYDSPRPTWSWQVSSPGASAW